MTVLLLAAQGARLDSGDRIDDLLFLCVAVVFVIAILIIGGVIADNAPRIYAAFVARMEARDATSRKNREADERLAKRYGVESLDTPGAVGRHFHGTE